jgi:predicted NUDIX family NTP pyrophosphohydrolase
VVRTASAGILLFRRTAHTDGLEVLLAHMGGPFWASKDDRSWTIPKGEFLPGEDPFAAAQREFAEEMGSAPTGEGYVELGTRRLSSTKELTVWAAEADFDHTAVVSNTFEMEWPPRSGRMQSFPEVDRAAWFSLDEAGIKLVAAQAVFLGLLVEAVARSAQGR